MSRLIIHGGHPLAGAVTPPADKSITHRALILGALARGTSVIGARSVGEDNLSTASVLRALGVTVRETAGGFEVEGVGGPSGLSAPSGPLDCGNSGTTLRLMAGVLAGAPFSSVLTGDASLRRRPMARLAPLVAMGAGLEGTTPPLTIHGCPLTGAHHRLPLASAQVKSAVLLAGLFAEGETRVWEPGRSRDHTERLLRAQGVRLSEDEDGTLILTP
ncbi:MAG: 3-phosphoshikimate 1-carboxyvinyltransferase, partial [Myxococcales bacterium]|nr:3-phosphoshikimate 1-carboxyvinyltransferase [Myxococcales bacterium]